MEPVLQTTAALIIFTALLGTPPAVAQTPAAVTVRDFSFQPRELTVASGTIVQWANRDAAPHKVESDDGRIVGPVIGDGDTFTFTFTTSGRVAYHCGIHPSMTGVIIVQ